MKKLPLVGVTEIAQLAGVQKSTVSQWKSRHESFPEPVADLYCGPIYLWPDVEKWLKSTGRQPDDDLE